jgi:hypothetical protein
MSFAPLRAGFAALVLLFGTSNIAEARIVEIFPYEQLFSKSDLVVIARPVAKTTDTDERTFFPELEEQIDDGPKHPVPAIGVQTPFHVEHVLKGDRRLKQFVLHHYREIPDPPGVVSVNGAGTVSFDPSVSKGTDFLLFLLKDKDGRYMPYGGQLDPDTVIFALAAPEFFIHH